MEQENFTREEFRVSGEDVIKTLKRILAEGNARKILVKSEEGETIAEFPLAFGAVGILAAPILAAAAAITAWVVNCTIVVEKKIKVENQKT